MKWIQAITGVVLVLLTILLIAVIVLNMSLTEHPFTYLRKDGLILLLLALLFGYYGVVLIKKSNG